MTGRGFGFEAKPGSDEWYSPPGLFDSMGVRFDLDPCGVPNTPAAAHCASMYVHPTGTEHDVSVPRTLHPTARRAQRNDV